MFKSNDKIIIICGPTASGKTGWGVGIAKKYDGEIISADSRQVFRGLDLGTGKDLNELKGIKYHLIDICGPGERFTLFDWLNGAREIIGEILARGKTPIVVGGTGLYIQALTEGFEIKGKGKSIQGKGKFKRGELDGMDLKELQKIAIKLSANSCQLQALDMNNPRRLIRFIEKAQSGEAPIKKKPPYQFLQIAPELPREELYRRIDKRVEGRFEEGMLNEVAGLIDSGINIDWLIGLGLEYRLITNYLVKSEIRNPKSETNPNDQNSKKLKSYDLKPFENMKQELKYKIHQFARRQLTWFRRFPEIKWVENYREAGRLTKQFLES